MEEQGDYAMNRYSGLKNKIVEINHYDNGMNFFLVQRKSANVINNQIYSSYENGRL